MPDKKDKSILQVQAEAMLKNGGALVDPLWMSLPVIESVLPPLPKSVLDKLKEDD